MVYMTVDLSDRSAPNRQVRKALKDRPFDRQVFMPVGKCRKRVVSGVVSTPNQPNQPKTMSGVAYIFAMASVDEVNVEVPVEPRRHRKRGWCESVETSATKKAWTAREDARKVVGTPSREKTAWKAIRTACATLWKVIRHTGTLTRATIKGCIFG